MDRQTRKTLKIGKPEIVNDGDRSVLRASIDDAGEDKKLEYRVDSKWESALTVERSDAFVVALLYYCMIKERDIEWTTPCNEQLIYQLETYLIPVYAQEIPFMHGIYLKGPVTTELLSCEGGVATGVSNGVDSDYTMRKYLDTKYLSYRLTHLIFTDCFTTDMSEEYHQNYLNQYLSVLPECAKELGLEFIYVEFHLDVQFSIGHIYDKVCGMIQDVGLYTLKYCSIAIALQKLLHLYYFSSGYSPSDFSLKRDDMSYHDLFTLPIITTRAVEFYSVGMEVPRIEKVKAIADWSYAQKHLQVCQMDNDHNCGKCSKCIRTMSELYALGELEHFRERFPVDDYMEHLSQRFAEVLMQARHGHVFEQNILAKMKGNGKKVPKGAYLLAPFYTLKEFVRVRLRTKKWARKIYRSFHLDRLLYGRSTQRYTQSVDREILGEK